VTKQVQFRLPLWSAVVIAAASAVGVTYFATSLAMANRNNELLRENIRIRKELDASREKVQRLERGVANVYRVALLDLVKRLGVAERGEGPIFLTVVNAVDAIGDPVPFGIGGGDHDLPEMRRGTNAEDLGSD
jgi:hypothetical protein